MDAHCDNCGHTFTYHEGDLGEIPYLWQRIEPGSEVPAAACPRCGALAYLVGQPTGEFSPAVLLPAALAACRAALAVLEGLAPLVRQDYPQQAATWLDGEVPMQMLRAVLQPAAALSHPVSANIGDRALAQELYQALQEVLDRADIDAILATPILRRARAALQRAAPVVS